jgi:hypothetical protein
MLWVMKIDEKGTTIWKTTFNGPWVASSLEYAHDDGYIIAGKITEQSTDHLWIASLDKQGNPRWNTTYPQDGWVYDIQQTPDGYFILGEFQSDMNGHTGLLHIDTKGTIKACEDYEQTFVSMTASMKGGYLLAGRNSSDSGIIIKIDDQGNLLWTKEFLNPGHQPMFFAIEPASDGRYALTGEIFDPLDGYFDIWFVIINETGDVHENTIVDGPFITNSGYDVIQTWNNRFVISCCRGVIAGGMPRPAVVKIDIQGNRLWQQVIEDHSPGIVFCNNLVQETHQGGYITLCYTNETSYQPPVNSNVMVVKYRSEDIYPPVLTLVSPEDGVYLNDHKLLSFQKSIVLGYVDVNCTVSDDQTGVEKVEIIVNDELRTTISHPPYSWIWDEHGFGSYHLKVIVYDHAGNKDLAEKQVFFLW